jgi:hypothetical protein
LVAILFDEFRRRPDSNRFPLALVRIETVLLTGFVIGSAGAYFWGINSMALVQRTRLLGKGALLFTNVLDAAEIQSRYLVANNFDARRFANMEDRIGLIHPPMIRSAEIASLDLRPQDGGFFDELTVAGQTCQAKGWAMLPKQGRPADCVVLSFESADGRATAFHVADESFERPDVAEVLKNSNLTNSGWSCRFDRSLVPEGEHLIKAWAFDAKKGVLYPLLTPKTLP